MDLQIFKNEDCGEIRIVEENGKVWFCGSDVAKALGYTNPNKAINDHCRCITKRYTPHPQSPDKTIEMSFIPEGDVYRLITHSKLPSAQKFESWVFDEVIPSIHKHGAYMTGETLEKALTSPDFLIELATKLKEEQAKRIELESKIEEDKPKVLFAQAVETSKSTILVGDLAKILRQNGVNIGQRRLFDWLRDNGYLMKAGSSRNLPTQSAMDAGLFEIKESTVNNPDGSIRINKTTKVTGKGQTYFVNKFLAAV